MSGVKATKDQVSKELSDDAAAALEALKALPPEARKKVVAAVKIAVERRGRPEIPDWEQLSEMADLIVHVPGLSERKASGTIARGRDGHSEEAVASRYRRKYRDFRSRLQEEALRRYFDGSPPGWEAPRPVRVKERSLFTSEIDSAVEDLRARYRTVDDWIEHLRTPSLLDAVAAFEAEQAAFSPEALARAVASVELTWQECASAIESLKNPQPDLSLAIRGMAAERENLEETLRSIRERSDLGQQIKAELATACRQLLDAG